jgi:hypothetical protein
LTSGFAAVPRPQKRSALEAVVRQKQPCHRNDQLTDCTVAVVGLGHIGLPTGLALAPTGRSVLGCGIRKIRLTDIKSSRPARGRSRQARPTPRITTVGTLAGGNLRLAGCVPGGYREEIGGCLSTASGERPHPHRPPLAYHRPSTCSIVTTTTSARG